ncbi:MAG TPA: FdtA/QdtA family cupin domain-containing protein [Burkholderiales bacterium]|nr:FdtA/QdtA family cupin domain-containing protein [Burkholderiales bacterium]
MLRQFIDFAVKGDDKGFLISLESFKNIPFNIKRVYYIFGTLENVRRGFHAHYKIEQIAVCIKGSCKFLLDDGKIKDIVTLNNNHTGLVIPPMIWHEMFDFSPDCVLMVLANDYYYESDYIRNYNDFIKLANKL